MKPKVTPWEYQELLRKSPSEGEPADWLGALRASGQASLESVAIPTRKSESWRYAGAQRLFQQPFHPLPAAAASTYAQLAGRLPASLQDGIRVILVNGRLVPEEGSDMQLPAGVLLAGLNHNLLDSWDRSLPRPGELVEAGRNVFTAMNAAGADGGLFIGVRAGVRLEQPIEVIHVAHNGERPGLSQPRSLVHLGANASATVVEYFLDSGNGEVFCNAVTETHLGEGASLEHLQLQDQGTDSQHLCTEGVRLHTNSHYRATRIALGGSWARNEIDVDLAGEQADADIAGLFTVAGERFNNIGLDIRHAAPTCKSTTRIKGILHGRGRGVVDGHIRVDKGAAKTDASLNSANLLLSRDAEIDTKPTLEIYADDVKCSHGATVGRLDPLQVFYLRSRGIDRAGAERLLSLGFAREVLDRCPYPELRSHLEKILESRLSETMPEQGGSEA